MICFGWAGFPQYGARCVRAFVDSTDEEVVVVATPPQVPIAGMEELCGCRVIWVEDNDPRTLRELLEGKLPRFMTISGWFLKNYLEYAKDVRANGGLAVACCDNNYQGWSVKECLKALKFRLMTRNRFDGFFVPGESARKLLRFYGVPDEKIVKGMYAADDTLFCPGAALSQRAKKIIYVGQFIERKNVLRMCRAFLSAGGPEAGWSLELYGSGPLEGVLREIGIGLGLRSRSTVEVHSFLQPEELAAKYRASRAFCLPSLEEHWGLVVHEAALSGCMLLLSDRVGAMADFAGERNVLAFNPSSESQMTDAFRRLFTMDDASLDAAGRESESKGQIGASLAQFVAAVNAFLPRPSP